MGLFSWRKRQPAALPVPEGRDPAEPGLLAFLHREIEKCGFFRKGHLLYGPQSLETIDGRLLIEVQVQEVTDYKLHAHVVAWLPDPKGRSRPNELNACVFGHGPVKEAVEQWASNWVQLVGAPLFSCMLGRPVLSADHFSGSEPWGVPGGHGFVGPVMVRGDRSGIDVEGLAETRAFDFDGYPRDGRRHLAKAILMGKDGRWTRTLEIDGHKQQSIDEDWQFGVPAPDGPIVCIRFAVFDFPD